MLVVTLLVTILVFGVPFFDTVQVILTRLAAGIPIYKPDKRHVRHRLLRIGLTQTQTVLDICHWNRIFDPFSYRVGSFLASKLEETIKLGPRIIARPFTIWYD